MGISTQLEVVHSCGLDLIVSDPLPPPRLSFSLTNRQVLGNTRNLKIEQQISPAHSLGLGWAVDSCGTQQLAHMALWSGRGKPWKKQPHAFQKRAIILDAVFGLAAHLRPCWPRCFGPESLVPLGTQLSEGPALPGNGNGLTGPGKMGIQQEALEQKGRKAKGPKLLRLKGASLQTEDQIKDAYVTKHGWIHCGQTESHLEE